MIPFLRFKIFDRKPVFALFLIIILTFLMIAIWGKSTSFKAVGSLLAVKDVYGVGPCRYMVIVKLEGSEVSRRVDKRKIVFNAFISLLILGFLVRIYRIRTKEGITRLDSGSKE